VAQSPATSWRYINPVTQLPMPKNTATPTAVSLGQAQHERSAHFERPHNNTPANVPRDEESCHRGALSRTCVKEPRPNEDRAQVARGLTEQVATFQLRDGIWRRALALANRFRVIRTIDVAAACFPERPFKASLTAAQRAVRGMVKAKLLARYRTNRFQTVYGLTARGATWLQYAGLEASSSVRRVSDMSNPEHRLWLQFLVIACEARGLRALTESEVLRALNESARPGQAMAQGVLAVSWTRGGKTVRQSLRPDAIAYEADGATWFEADISKRGAGREAALAALAASVGRQLPLGVPLRRVVVFSKTERIRKRALAVIQGMAEEQNAKVLVGDRAHLRQAEEGVFEVWRAVEDRLPDGRTRPVDTRMGYVIVQALPTWLPKLRLEHVDQAITGWFSDGLLPYKRPSLQQVWPPCTSPLLRAPTSSLSVGSSETETDRTGGK
jgi:hypothetical protein